MTAPVVLDCSNALAGIFILKGGIQEWASNCASVRGTSRKMRDIRPQARLDDKFGGQP
jgi:hypothetical protein